MKEEVGQNIIYDPVAVARARRQDLLVHLRALGEGIRIADRDCNQHDADLFKARSREVQRELARAFPLKGKSNLTDGFV